jgi:hypothetical protein
MKKQLLTFSIALSTFFSFAQITINTADGPQVNLGVITRQDTTSTQGIGSNSASSQTWNFSSLANHVEDSTYFTSPTGTPAQSTFSTSNLCLANPDDTAWVYFTNSSTAFTMDGIYAYNSQLGMYLTLKYNPPSKYITWPSTYGTSFNNTAKTSFKTAINQPPADSAWYKVSVVQTSNINAFGSLTTPAGTYNCIRQDYMDIEIDSIFAHAFGFWSFYSVSKDTTRGSRWYTNGQGYPVMETELVPSTGAVNSTTYLSFSIVLDEKEVKKSNEFVLTYPNPASDEIHFATKNNEGAEIRITDAQGKLVEVLKVNSDLMKVNSSLYPSGTYFYSMTGKNLAKPLTGTIQVTH